MQTSTEIAHAEDYRTRNDIRDAEAALAETQNLSWCEGCESWQASTRDVKINGWLNPLCRDCRPFDRTCEACGQAESHPGFDGCLACEITGDLYDLEAQRLARALFHVFMGLANDKLSVQAEIARAM